MIRRGSLLEALIEHVVSCKPGFDRLVDDLEQELERLYKTQEALVWRLGLPGSNYPQKHKEALEKTLKDHKAFLENSERNNVE